MNDRELNRALLARQGLLERIDAPVAEALERIGAVQAQSWPAAAVALWSRVEAFTPQVLYDALEDGTALTALVHRGTVHLMSAREHPMYAGTFAASGNAVPWRRQAPGDDGDALRAALVQAATGTAITAKDVARLAEDWVAEHPDAIPEEELEAQRKVGWRTLLRCGDLVRVPASGTWGSKAPDAVTAPPEERLAPERAVDAAVLAHLRAFGPAGADDVASWLGLKTGQAKQALERAGEDIVEIEGRRTLYDVPDGPRPDGDAEAPARFLAAFDSVILAYAPKRRSRLIPEGRFEQIYNRANLQIRPTFLLDGIVAGLWSTEVKGRKATLTVTPFARLPRGAKGELTAEAEALLQGVHPAATNRTIAFEPVTG
jgi:hypothetical protein